MSSPGQGQLDFPDPEVLPLKRRRLAAANAKDKQGVRGTGFLALDDFSSATLVRLPCGGRGKQLRIMRQTLLGDNDRGAVDGEDNVAGEAEGLEASNESAVEGSGREDHFTEEMETEEGDGEHARHLASPRAEEEEIVTRVANSPPAEGVMVPTGQAVGPTGTDGIETTSESAPVTVWPPSTLDDPMISGGARPITIPRSIDQGLPSSGISAGLLTATATSLPLVGAFGVGTGALGDGTGAVGTSSSCRAPIATDPLSTSVALPVTFGNDSTGWRGLSCDARDIELLELVYQNYPNTFTCLAEYSSGFGAFLCRTLAALLLSMQGIRLATVAPDVLCELEVQIRDLKRAGLDLGWLDTHLSSLDSYRRHMESSATDAVLASQELSMRSEIMAVRTRLVELLEELSVVQGKLQDLHTKMDSDGFQGVVAADSCILVGLFPVTGGAPCRP